MIINSPQTFHSSSFYSYCFVWNLTGTQLNYFWAVYLMKTLNTSVNMCSSWILKGLPYYLLSFWSMYLLSLCYLTIIFMTQLLKYLLSSFLSLSNCPRKKRHLDLLDSFWNGALWLGIMHLLAISLAISLLDILYKNVNCWFKHQW